MLTPTGLLAALWFLAPAGAANMAPVFAQRLFPTWQAPVDFGCTVRGRRLFGSHKTWRGMAAGVAAGAAIFMIQQFLFVEFGVVRDLSAFDYPRQPALLGAWLGLGALTGDLVRSAAKRQMDIAPGHPWVPFDQIDWLVGALAFGWIALDLPFALLISVLAVGIMSHVLVNIVGYLLRLRQTWI